MAIKRSRGKPQGTGKDGRAPVGPELPAGPVSRWSESEQVRVARSVQVSDQVLAELARSEHIAARVQVARHPAAGQLLARLGGDADPAVRAVVVEHDGISVDLLEHLTRDPDSRVRQLAIERHATMQHSFRTIDQAMGRPGLEGSIEALAEITGVQDEALISFLRVRTTDAAVRERLGQLLQERQSPDQDQQQQSQPTGSESGRPLRGLPALPFGLDWPSEAYNTSPEAKRGCGGIVAFLERVWTPFLGAAPGVVELRVLRAIDPSAAMGITKLRQRGQSLPEHIDIPTERELTDRKIRAAGGIEQALTQRPDLTHTIITRLRRAKMRQT